MIRIKESVETPDGKRVKTMEMTVKELYAHCVLLEGRMGRSEMPGLLEIEKDKSVK